MNVLEQLCTYKCKCKHFMSSKKFSPFVPNRVDGQKLAGGLEVSQLEALVGPRGKREGVGVEVEVERCLGS